jgi:hypothetical protein
MMSNQQIQDLKADLIQGVMGVNGDRNNLFHQRADMILTAAMAADGFHQKVATTVRKTGQASEKQAYVIARGLVESGLDSIEKVETAAKQALFGM